MAKRTFVKGASGMDYEVGNKGSLGKDMARNLLGYGKPARQSDLKMPKFEVDEHLPLTRVNIKAKTHRGY
jgi:hypothetical protein